MNYLNEKNLFLGTYNLDKLLGNLDDIVLENDIKDNNYPPYNLIKVSDNSYLIEIALLGFNKKDLSVSSKDNKLYIEGKTSKDRNVEFLFQGIKTKNFRHQFNLSETILVKSANYEDGILSIDLENIIPDEKKLKNIPINIKSKLFEEEKELG
tara:strand:- start:125 stop:583 length:459 start_codon:yes stop_codon:yes gene_type:complete